MKKRALNQRVLCKISHLTISSLVIISNKRLGQLNLCYQPETIHLRWKRSQLRETFADKVMLECCYQLCAFASADSKSKVEPSGACISFIQLRLVVFMIECDKVGFSISFPSVVFVRKSRLRSLLFPFPSLQSSSCEKADFVEASDNNSVCYLSLIYSHI